MTGGSRFLKARRLIRVLINPHDSQPQKTGGKDDRIGIKPPDGLIAWPGESRETCTRAHQRGILGDSLPWTDATPPLKNGEYDYVMPYRTSDDSAETELIQALAATPAFRRLADVRFLGALDYFLITHPNGALTNQRYTRLQHSLGVAALAKAYLDLRRHTPQQRLLCVAAAMLHDVGHPPFSHTLEPVFEELFGIDHHRATERIISGQTGLGKAVDDVLRSFGVNPLSVIDTLNGGDIFFDHFFSGPINFDTIEGILRARNYLKMQRLGLSPLKVMKAAAYREGRHNQDVVDSFWQCKHEMYTLVIRSKHGVLYDSLFQAIARKHITELRDTDFFVTEAELFKRIPLFREVLSKDKIVDIAQSILPPKVAFQARQFFVDQNSGFKIGNDRVRYRQTKTPTSLTLGDILPASP